MRRIQTAMPLAAALMLWGCTGGIEAGTLGAHATFTAASRQYPIWAEGALEAGAMSLGLSRGSWEDTGYVGQEFELSGTLTGVQQ